MPKYAANVLCNSHRYTMICAMLPEYDTRFLFRRAHFYGMIRNQVDRYSRIETFEAKG
jgi:hypothetical protein